MQLGDIASHIDAKLVSARGAGDPLPETWLLEITGIANPAGAEANQLSFVASRQYVQDLETTGAAAVIIDSEMLSRCPVPALISDQPYLAYARATALFQQARAKAAISASATVHSSAVLGDDVVIGANAVVEAGANIGSRAEIGANSYVGMNAHIGRNTRLHPNVTVYHDVCIGDDCLVHSGTVLGSDGFGFAPINNGEADSPCWQKIHQLGTLLVGDRVEIGANCAIDRGSVENTEIEDDVIIDNLVHIAHNCSIGRGTALAGQVGMAGSTDIGKHCAFGGQVGLAGHLRVADGVHVTGKSMITKTIKQGGSYSSGTGFSETSVWRKNVIRFMQLDALSKRVKQLEKLIEGSGQ